MAIKKVQKKTDQTTEDKIKSAARTVFLKKGYAATRTRDIAEEADINLALLNYYFRSKEKLFDIIMLDIVHSFVSSIKIAFNDEETSFETKIEQVVYGYIDLLTIHPEIPLFILSELRMKPNEIVHKLGVKQVVMNSFFLKQFQQAIADKKIASIHPLHFIMNLMGLTVFPFIAAPILQGLGDISKTDYSDLIQERKKLVPMWIQAILKAK